MGLAWIVLLGGMLMSVSVGTDWFWLAVIFTNIAVIVWILLTNHTKTSSR